MNYTLISVNYRSIFVFLMARVKFLENATERGMFALQDLDPALTEVLHILEVYESMQKGADKNTMFNIPTIALTESYWGNMLDLL